MVEFAFIGSAAFLLIFGAVVGGLGVFRYQEVSYLTREGARYASTHGGQYQLDGQPAATGVSAISSSTDLQSYLQNELPLLEASQLNVSASWSAPSTITPNNIPYYMDTNPNLSPPGQSTIRNYVTVTVTYNWMPELFLVGPIKMSSTVTVPMSY
jgi:hypothetical protein